MNTAHGRRTELTTIVRNERRTNIYHMVWGMREWRHTADDGIKHIW